MIEGITKNVVMVSAGAYKDLDEAENFFPTLLDLRNGYMSDGGNWVKRPGYTQYRDLGIDRPVDLLIPEGGYGYAVLDTGRIFKITELSQVELTGTGLGGLNRPTWVNHKGTIIICGGGPPIKISGDVVSLLGGSPSNFKFIARVGNYTIGCGHDDTEWKNSASGNPENWTTGDSSFDNVMANGANDTIRNLIAVGNNKFYIFKGESIEEYRLKGGIPLFARVGIINRGVGADYSVVRESGVVYFLGDDLRFYSLSTNGLQVISSQYENYIQSTNDPSSCYGLNFIKEHLIKWVFPTDGKVIVFDYKNNMLSEDNTWEHGQFERIPMGSYMEINNKQYIGSYNLDGLVHEWSKDNLDDNGLPIRVYRKFKVKFSGQSNSARINRVRFRFKRGVATSSVISPKFMYRYKLDNKNWSETQDLYLGSIGDYDPYLTSSGWGVGREMLFESWQTDATEFIQTGMDMTVKELGR